MATDFTTRFFRWDERLPDGGVRHHSAVLRGWLLDVLVMNQLRDLATFSGDTLDENGEVL